MNQSLYLFVVLDHLVELAQLVVLVLVELLHYQLLGVDAVVHLLLELLQGCLHPVTVIFGWLHPFFLQPLLYVAPDLSHLQMGVHLDHLQLLLLLCS